MHICQILAVGRDVFDNKKLAYNATILAKYEYGLRIRRFLSAERLTSSRTS